MPIAMNIAAAAAIAVTKTSDAPTPMPTFALDPPAAAKTAIGTQSATMPAPSPIAACSAAPPRVVCPDRNSSHRPASSSPRSTRVAITSPQIAARMIRVIPTL